MAQMAPGIRTTVECGRQPARKYPALRRPGMTEQEIREKVARELEAEADEFEKQYGKEGRGGMAAGVLMEAARLVRDGSSSPEDQQLPSD